MSFQNLVLAWLLALTCWAKNDTRQIRPIGTGALKCVALLIGNAKYTANPLRNPPNDARAI